MGVQSAINSVIGSAGAAAALSDLSSSAKSTSKTVTELGVDAKMAAKARKEVQQKLDAIYTNQENWARARANVESIVNDPRIVDERTAQSLNNLTKTLNMDKIREDLKKAEEMDTRKQKGHK